MAIARVSNAYLSNTTGTSLTTAFDCGSGADCLIVGVVGDEVSDLISGVTYNGVPMTEFGQVAGQRYVHLFGLLAPASGSNNVVVSASSSSFIIACAASYSGVKQSGLPDSTATAGPSGPATSSIDTNFTIVDANSWTVLCAIFSGGSITAGTGSSAVQLETSFGNFMGLLDSNGPQSSGAYTMTVNGLVGSSYAVGTVGVSLAPATGGGSPALMQGRLVGGGILTKGRLVR